MDFRRNYSWVPEETKVGFKEKLKLDFRRSYSWVPEETKDGFKAWIN